MPDDIATELAREHWPATLWTMEQALAAYEAACDLTASSADWPEAALQVGMPPDNDDVRCARGVLYVLAAHQPKRRPARVRGLISGLNESVPEHAICAGACRRVGRDEPHPWPCPAIAPLLDGLGLGVQRAGGVVGG